MIESSFFLVKPFCAGHLLQYAVAMDAEQLLATNDYLVLCTADAAGTPWPSPVWYAWDGRRFLWVSRPESRHSRNLAVRPTASAVIFDSSVPGYAGEALYVEVEGAQVPDNELDEGIAAFSTQFEARGLGAWAVEQLSGDSPRRLYYATAGAASLLFKHDQRISTEMPNHAVLR